MCGIAGFCLSPNEKFNARKLSKCLLDQIVVRGEDATGASWVVPSKGSGDRPTIAVSKAPVPADQFEHYITKMPASAKRAILHTRWATKGSPENNLNNHPIVSGRIVGVHNGVITNDDKIFKHIGSRRIAQVDSESAFALLDATKHEPIRVLRSIEGRASLAWFNARDKRDLHLARLDGSPLAIGRTERGSLFFASTEQLLLNACKSAGVELAWSEEVMPYTYMRIRNGEIVDLSVIKDSVKNIA
jgi:glucosamine--fructose-6-phosphate aminotransferase (isomerizing)